MNGTTQITNVAVTPSTDDLKVTLDPFGVASSILLAADTKCQVDTRAQDLRATCSTRTRHSSSIRRRSKTFITGSG